MLGSCEALWMVIIFHLSSRPGSDQLLPYLHLFPRTADAAVPTCSPHGPAHTKPHQQDVPHPSVPTRHF